MKLLVSTEVDLSILLVMLSGVDRGSYISDLDLSIIGDTMGPCNPHIPDPPSMLADKTGFDRGEEKEASRRMEDGFLLGGGGVTITLESISGEEVGK